MKNTILTFLVLLAAHAGFSQNLNFNIRGAYTRPVKAEMLKEPKTMADICTGYPTDWIKNYISTEITVTANGTTMKAAGTNEVLTDEQRSILRKADIGTHIIIDVKYKYQNSITGLDDVFNMNFPLTYIPDVEAEFAGGQDLLKQYLKENTVSKIPPASSKNLKMATVLFTVDANGKIANARVTSSSGDEHMDKLFLEAINNMPDWKPAMNSKGKKISQDFNFSVGNAGC